jgi:hypothetical protein
MRSARDKSPRPSVCSASRTLRNKRRCFCHLSKTAMFRALPVISASVESLRNDECPRLFSQPVTGWSETCSAPKISSDAKVPYARYRSALLFSERRVSPGIVCSKIVSSTNDCVASFDDYCFLFVPRRFLSVVAEVSRPPFSPSRGRSQSPVWDCARRASLPARDESLPAQILPPECWAPFPRARVLRFLSLAFWVLRNKISVS